MSDVFFVDWQLWQQMSFSLAVLICMVVIVGIFRLHYLNWKSQRIMLEDEEKNSRLSEVRRTGLRVRRDNDIPFGVRAIESGIEVDGIWISRPTTPATPTEKRFASLTTLVTDDTQNKRKDVETPDPMEPFTPGSSPRLSPNDYYRPRQPSQLRSSAGDSDAAMRNLEGQDRLETYVPQQSHRRPSPPSQRTSGSSEQSQSPTFQTPQYQRPTRDYSPSAASSRANARTPDPFASNSRVNSLSGIPAMEYTATDSSTGMSQPARTFVPGQQTRR
ncbi:hypothetical protein MKZ38_004338 [Zalerion maritima]|uniref:Uncharacterized protein n=1 Tax=Zalerion maritima TaxID=339359 RepID=A0AAD5RLQ2_9PEZI|nr:hypothetical protein MKZ38_004338 [Zalerion maritima]